MSLFPVHNDACGFNLAGVIPQDYFRNGVLLNAAGTVTKAALAGGVNFQNGLQFTANGQVIVVDSTLGLPAGTTYVNGLPLSPAGALCVSSDAAVSYNHGLPFTENGSIRGVIA